ncbi:AMP-dependent synthetase/ligase [Halosimplex amylolyticum]|uniref:AMP-dependent synthetase/ligase n=1 Tax=Halosimplex amylolyticum TaxID=3396616 RepID=UPI003F56CE38
MGSVDRERAFDDPVLGESTLAQMFENSAARNADRPAQRYKGGVYDRSLAGVAFPAAPDGEFATLTYDEMAAVVRRLAAGFRDLGVERGDRVGLYADTRMEWAQTDFAVLAAGGVVSTVYKSSSESQAAYLLDDPDATGVVVENETCLERVYENDADLDLDFFVVMDDPGRFAGESDVYTLGEVYERGADQYNEAAYEGWLYESDVDDLASLVYTSGTTGKPKGVRLTHRNFRSNVDQVYRRYGPRPDKPSELSIDTDTTTVSFLPLAHVFERLAGHFLIFAAGGTVAYAESVDTLKEDFQTVEPTSATAVPRVFEKMYGAIREEAQSSSVAERIFQWASDVARAHHHADDPGRLLSVKHSVADRLVYSDVRAALGGNIDFMVSGGGTLSAELAALYHGMGLPVFEGYGLTEAAPVVTTNPPTDPKTGTIGPLVQDIDARLDTDIDAEFDAEGAVGELLVSGPNVTDGYWERPEATADAFTDDGYLRTGDIVERRPDDYFVFHERAKQLIVLSTGKNIPPGPIEERFGDISIIEQVMVLGSDRKFVSALVVPDVDGLTFFAESEGVSIPEDRQAICESDAARNLVEREIERVNRDFEEHERIKKFRLVPEEFTQENGLLTPTMKKKRRDIRDRYAAEVADMYGEKAFESAPSTDDD